ncbi:MAG TPA: PH domain-containing protein [Jatrophihabitantaceae bacterium]|jgi:hypothetical protein|nr:PH domain-containing protein [Jatrophihabitantaceae bacterium]
MTAYSQLTVTARPVLLTKIARVTAAVVFLIFLVISVVMTRANAGVSFGPKDQVGTGVLGVLIAAAILLLARPRLVADAASVRIRSFAGSYRTIPWSVIVGVEFPSKVNFARLVLPGDETLALYAVQRIDKELAVEVMRGLRVLFAQTHPESS